MRLVNSKYNLKIEFEENKSTEFSRLVRLMIYSLFLDLNDYYIGISNFHKYIDELNFALKESM